MPFRDFDAARRERYAELDPVLFAFGGEKFTCLPAPALVDVLDLADVPDRSTNEVDAMRGLVRFIQRLLPEQDRERFAEACKNRDDPVDADEVYELVGWIQREMFGRPTSPSNGSAGGRRNGGDSSSSKRSAKGSTSARSRLASASTGSSAESGPESPPSTPKTSTTGSRVRMSDL